MVEANLNTTNLLLGIMAAVSVIQGVVLLAVGIMAWKLYTQTAQTVREIEARQIAPLVARVNVLMQSVDGVLADIKHITSRVDQQTERVSSAITTVDETAGRVRDSVSNRVHRVLGIMQGVKSVVGTFLNGQSRRAAT